MKQNISVHPLIHIHTYLFYEGNILGQAKFYTHKRGGGRKSSNHDEGGPQQVLREIYHGLGS